MTSNHYHERQFFNALRDIFVGAKIEGESGFINLMRIKSRYYQDGVFPKLKHDIDQAVQEFPAFREELFDKLYTFFERYFSESGSIYFRYTPLHQKVYEQVYTNDRDVVLFWKTHMLYYVKTDRIFNSLKVEVDGSNFFFDAVNIEHKRANEKRNVVFSFREVAQDGTLVFDTAYSVRGRVTKIDQILKDLRKEDVILSDETLEKAFRVFEKQSEVDYFINKNARAFLEEQFDLWMYQYLFAEKNIWSAERLAQLQALKDIAYKVIAFISQFEDELVKIWNKPKFVRNSHYIITLDHLIKKKKELLKVLFAHNGMQKQIEEWVSLGMLERTMKSDELMWQISAIDLTGEFQHPQFHTLPLDTRYFPDLEFKILACFEDLDQALDGWLIHSENYQMLNTLISKFYQRVNCIHIDPPYNTETSGFLYKNDFRHSSWLTMMDNRISKCYEYLIEKGSFISHIDENEYERLFLLLDSLNILNAGTLIWDKRNPMNAGRGLANQHEYIIWRSNIDSPINQKNDTILQMISKASELSKKFGVGSLEASSAYKKWIKNNKQLSGGEKAYYHLDEKGRIFQSVSLRAPEPRTDLKFFIPLIHPRTGKPCPVPPNGFSRTPETLKDMIVRGEILFGDNESVQPRQKYYLNKTSQKQLSSLIQDARKGRADISPLGLEFAYCHPVTLYKELIAASLSEPEGIVLDYFAGSGTTAHAVMNLNREDGGSRKYILVEMGEHFHDVILPRIKKIAFHSKWKEGKPAFESGESGMSHFVKYYDLESYEEVLGRVHYEDADLFDDPNQDPYHAYVFLRDLKLLDSVDPDPETDRVHFHPERLYPDIDLAETLSHLRGKWIKRITEDYVEFEDGEQMSLTDPDWETVKPMVWWR